MTISYAITVCNEAVELHALLSLLKDSIRHDSDEVVIVCDQGNTTEQVKDVLSEFDFVKIYEHALNKNFADHKNFLNSKCTKDYIFNIDADEMPCVDLLEMLPEILDANSDTDLICVPRINIVYGITEDHINRWGWRVNEKGYINSPDFQRRIYRNSPDIKWVGAVHEIIDGHKKYAVLPIEEMYSIYHIKTIDKQEKQNEFYTTIN